MRVQTGKRQQDKRNNFFKRFILFTTVLGVLVLFILNIINSNTKIVNASQTAAEISPTPTPEPVNPKIIDLKNKINDLIAEYKDKGMDNASVVLSDNNLLGKISINQDKVYASASLFKLYVLWELQREINQKILSDNTMLTLTATNDKSDDDGGTIGNYGDIFPISRLRELMIEESNNTAAAMIVEQITFTKIQNMIKSFGFNETTLSGTQSTSANDIYKLFSGIENRKLDPLLAQKDYDLMIDLLKNQKINNAISEGLDKNEIFAHKTANLDNVVHDAGIIILPNNHNITVVAMTQGTNFASYGFLYKLGQIIDNEMI